MNYEESQKILKALREAQSNVKASVTQEEANYFGIQELNITSILNKKD